MPADLLQLRRRLARKLAELEPMLEPAFERDPVFPGWICTSRHRCGKPNGHCAGGELHEATRLVIHFKDGAAYRCLHQDAVELWRPRAEAYRRVRAARLSFAKWQKEIVELLDAIERVRRRTDGRGARSTPAPLLPGGPVD